MTNDRRTFVKQASVMMAARVVDARPRSAPDAPFVHHVLFWLEDSSDRAAHNRLVAALNELRKVDTVRFLHVGAPSVSDIPQEARATDASYSVSYLALFDSRAEKEQYLRHPLHMKFFEDFGPNRGILSKVLVYDSMRISE